MTITMVANPLSTKKDQEAFYEDKRYAYFITENSDIIVYEKKTGNSERVSPVCLCNTPHRKMILGLAFNNKMGI